MIRLFLLLLTTFNSNAIDLFKADYTVYKDGKQIGTSSIELSQNNSLYTITDKTNGTHGMASFLGFKRSEITAFAEENGELIPTSYTMQQKVAFKKRISSYTVNKATQMIHGSYKGESWQQQKPNIFYTPNLVSLKLFQDICANKTTGLNYKVLKRGTLKDYDFKIISTKDNIIEIDKIHINQKTITKTWLDTKQHCLPVRTYHQEKDATALETKLISSSLQR